MSNQAFIVPTRFADLNRDGSEGSVNFGLRVFDDHSSTYDNVQIESMEQLMAMSDLEIVAMARGLNDTAEAIIDFSEEFGRGIIIFDDLVEWKNLKSAAPAA